MTGSVNISPIGIIHSCFKEKFGVPRQPLMVPAATAVLKLNKDARFTLALNHLGEFSHIWILYLFHRNIEKGWKPTVQTPRIEAPESVGVFASRSPHRPNPIGMSLVKLDKIHFAAPDGIELHISGVDILDQTPVVDIKPYLPFADSCAEANAGWAKEEIKKYKVEYSSKALEQIEGVFHDRHKYLKELLTQMLEWDPRPTSQRLSTPMEALSSQSKPFAFRLFDFDVKWEIRDFAIFVHELELLS